LLSDLRAGDSAFSFTFRMRNPVGAADQPTGRGTDDGSRSNGGGDNLQYGQGRIPTTRKRGRAFPARCTQSRIRGRNPHHSCDFIDALDQNKSDGEPFQASLANDLADGDWVVARKGASVTGVISDSDPGGRVKGVASITLQLKKLMLADGREVSISTTAYGAEAKSSKKKDAARIGIGAGIGAAVGAIAGGGKGAAIGAGVGGAAGTGATLAKRGDPAAIPSETPIRFELTAPLEIVEQK